MATLTSKLIVELIDRATAPARAIAAGVNRLTAMQSRNAAALATAQTQMIGAVGVAYALAKAFGAPVSAAVDFETKLEDIGQKINAPVSDLPKLGEELRAVGRQTSQAASQMALGMDTLAGLGAGREDALGLLPAIGRAATAYNAQVVDLSNAGYAALDNLKVPANQFAKALDAMAQAGKAGAFELKDMAKYFPALGSAYQGLGQKGVPAVADLSAALQIVRKGAGDSAEAATNLNNILQKINAPATRQKFKKMGVNLEKEMKSLTDAGMTPIEAIAVLTNKVLKGDLGKLGDLFEDAQVQKGLRPLIQNIEEYRRIRKEALAAQGVVEEDYQRRLKTGASANQRFRIALEGINLAIGAALLPGLTDLADAIVPLMNRMASFAEKHPAVTRAVVATTAGLIGLRIAGIAAKFGLLWLWGGALATAIGGMRLLSGALRLGAIALFPFGAAARGLSAAFFATRGAIFAFMTAATLMGTGGALKMAAASIFSIAAAMNVLKFALIGTGIGAVLLGIAAAGSFIYQNWSGIKEMFSGIGEGLRSSLAPVSSVIQPIVDAFSRLVNMLATITEPLNMSKQAWRDLGVTIGTSVGGAITGVIEKIKSLIGWITSVPGKIAGMLGGGSKSAASGAAPAIAGARAAGGPVRAGSTYLVGENGPELFRARANGAISSTMDTVRAIKANALAGAAQARGGTVNNVNVGGIHVQGAPGQSPEAIASAVERKLSEKLAALSRGAFSDGVY